MKLLCVVTIDTEPDCSINWNRSNPLKFDSVLSGIPKILRLLWDKYKVNPVYFVSPEVAESDNCCRVLKNELRRGSEIGAHLHAEYVEPQKKYLKYDGTRSNEYPCFAYSNDIEQKKIENLTNIIEKNIGCKPTSYRAARFGADQDTFRSLMSLGYTVDSSITPGIDWSGQGGPDYRDFTDQPYLVNFDGLNRSLLEVPVTVGKKRITFLSNNWLNYAWLRPTHMSVWEEKKLVDEFVEKYRDEDLLVLCLMFHSMEIIPKASPYVRSKLGQRLFLRRLESILKFLRHKNFSFVTLKDIYNFYHAS